MENTVNKKFDKYASIVFLVLALSVFIYSNTRLQTDNVGIAIGPAALPAFLSSILMILSVINFIAAVRSKAPDAPKAKLEYKKFFIILGSAICYALLIEPLGYILTTFAFLMVGFQTIERGGMIKSAIIAASIAGGVYYLYVEIAMGTLPGFPSFLGI